MPAARLIAYTVVQWLLQVLSVADGRHLRQIVSEPDQQCMLTAEGQRRRRLHGRTLKRGVLVNPRPHWPPLMGGLSMEVTGAGKSQSLPMCVYSCSAQIEGCHCTACAIVCCNRRINTQRAAAVCICPFVRPHCGAGSV